jgi:hypothetical protein
MPQQFLRPVDAAIFLKSLIGFGAVRSLAKMPVLGNGPVYRKAGRLVLYEQGDLMSWAEPKVSSPLRSTSDVPRQRSPSSVNGEISTK